MDSTVNHVSRSTAHLTASRRGRSRRHLDPRGRSYTRAARDVTSGAPLRCDNSGSCCATVVGRDAITSLVVAARGVWTPRERSTVRRQLRGLAQRVEVISDVEAALLGALDGRPGLLGARRHRLDRPGPRWRGARGPRRRTGPADRGRGLGVLAGSRMAPAHADGRRHRTQAVPTARCRRARGGVGALVLTRARRGDPRAARSPPPARSTWPHSRAVSYEPCSCPRPCAFPGVAAWPATPGIAPASAGPSAGDSPAAGKLP